MTKRILVRDLMTVGVPTCPADTPLQELTQLFITKHLESAVVLNSEGHGIGMVTQHELVKAYTQDDYEKLCAEDIMRADIPQIPPDIPLRVAAQLMQDQGVREFFVMHNSEGIIYPAAFITYRHFLRHLAAGDDSELADLGILATRKNPVELFMERREAAKRKMQASDSLG